MKQGLILLLAMCVFAVAMVPRERRAVNTEEDEEQLRLQSTTNKTTEKQICAPQTPCRWIMYKPPLKYEEMNITNSYCECSANTTCQRDEDDLSISTYVYRCRSPSAPETTDDSQPAADS